MNRNNQSIEFDINNSEVGSILSIQGDKNTQIVYNYYYSSINKASISSKHTETSVSENLSCPYRGLSHFSPDDAEYFFGREDFVTVLFNATKTRNFITVLGASGSGKSSVVLAGLVPRLQKEGNWIFTHFRPGDHDDPFYSLAEALVPLYRSDYDSTDEITQTNKLAESLRKKEFAISQVFSKIQRKNSAHRVLLIADQFEELYTSCSDESIRHIFLDTLLAGFQSKSNHFRQPPLVLVSTLRVDFLSNALSYPPFADVLQNANIMLGAMKREELSQVIKNPAEKQNVTFESGLVERILNDVEDEPGNLPLLEFALTELWKRRIGQQLTHQAYQDIGQVKGALESYANEIYKRFTEN